MAAGAICGTCLNSTNNATIPTCGRPDCPNKLVGFLRSDFEKKTASERLANLKQAFDENDIPWPLSAGKSPE